MKRAKGNSPLALLFVRDSLLENYASSRAFAAPDIVRLAMPLFLKNQKLTPLANLLQFVEDVA